MMGYWDVFWHVAAFTTCAVGLALGAALVVTGFMIWNIAAGIAALIVMLFAIVAVVSALAVKYQ